MSKLLYELYKEQVVSFDLSRDKKKIEITEGCDRYYGLHLSKEEFGQLIEELKELHGQMVRGE